MDKCQICQNQIIYKNKYHYRIKKTCSVECFRKLKLIQNRSDLLRKLNSTTNKGKSDIERYGKEKAKLKLEKYKNSMKDYKHSVETKEKIRVKSIGHFPSKESRLKNGLAHIGKIPGCFNKYFVYQNNIYRSKWEIGFVKWCNQNNIKCIYESKIFNLDEFCYIPDFYLPEYNMWVEIKGFYYERSKQKIEAFREKVSKNLWIIDGSNYNFIDNKWKNKIINEYNLTYEDYLNEEYVNEHYEKYENNNLIVCLSNGE